jgi:hypothetical protein
MLRHKSGCIIFVHQDGKNCCARVSSDSSTRTEHGARCVIDHIVASFKFENNIPFRNECYYEFDNDNESMNYQGSSEKTPHHYNFLDEKFVARIYRPTHLSVRAIFSK